MNNEIKIPNWFWKLRKKDKLAFNFPTIDHLIAIKRYNRIEVHSRPYSIIENQIKKIFKICEKNEVHIKIKGETSYRNKDTLTIIFYKGEEY